MAVVGMVVFADLVIVWFGWSVSGGCSPFGWFPWSPPSLLVARNPLPRRFDDSLEITLAGCGRLRDLGDFGDLYFKCPASATTARLIIACPASATTARHLTYSVLSPPRRPGTSRSSSYKVSCVRHDGQAPQLQCVLRPPRRPETGPEILPGLKIRKRRHRRRQLRFGSTALQEEAYAGRLAKPPCRAARARRLEKSIASSCFFGARSPPWPHGTLSRWYWCSRDLHWSETDSV